MASPLGVRCLRSRSLLINTGVGVAFFLDRYIIASFYVIAKGTAMDLILIIIILLFLFGGLGGGYYGYSHYGAGGGIGIFGVILIVVVVLFIFRRGRL